MAANRTKMNATLAEWVGVIFYGKEDVGMEMVPMAIHQVTIRYLQSLRSSNLSC